MDGKIVEKIKKLILDFRLLVTKVQKENKAKNNNQKETNKVLEAFRKEYQKLHHGNET